MEISVLRALSFVVIASVIVSASACSSSSADKGSGTGDAGAETSTNDASGGDASGGDASGGDASGGDTCNTLCVAAKFASGKATQFGADVLECQCSGTSSVGGITKPACETYCAPKVAPAKALLSSEVSPNDKCVCDGT